MDVITDRPQANISEEHKELLKKFRTNLADILTVYHTDTILLKFLRARNYNLKKAEQNFREVDSNRKIFGVNEILETYVKPEAAEKHECTGFLGFAKDGTALRYSGVGKADVQGFLMALSIYDICLYFSYLMEYDIAALRAENAKTGRKTDEITYIIDLDGFTISQFASKSVIETGLDFSRLFQDCYPEIWRNVFFVNTPMHFDKLFNIVKPILKATLLDKMRVVSRALTPQVLLKYVDEDVLPTFLGGKRVDSTGDPMCRELLKCGGKIPEKFYIKNRIPLLMSSDPEVMSIVIGARSAYNYPVVAREAGTKFRIDFRTENGSINIFMLFREFGSDPNHLDIPSSDEFLDGNDENCGVRHASVALRSQSHLAQVWGEATTPWPGIYIIRFDNTYSWFTSRKLFFRVSVHPPLR